MSWRECAALPLRIVAWRFPTLFNYRGGIGGQRTMAWRTAQRLAMTAICGTYLKQQRPVRSAKRTLDTYGKEHLYGDWNGKVVQRDQGLWLHSA